MSTTTPMRSRSRTRHPICCSPSLPLDLLLCPIVVVDLYYTVIVYFRYYSPTTVSRGSLLPLCSLVACSCRSAPVDLNASRVVLPIVFFCVLYNMGRDKRETFKFDV